MVSVPFAIILIIVSGMIVTPIAATTTTTTPLSQPGSGSNTSTVSTSSEVMSDQDFSEFSGFNNSDSSEDFDSSLLSSFITDVNGTYMNPSIGFQIDLPTGWKGKEISFLINSVFAAPEEINLLELEGEEALQNLSSLMTVVGIDEETFDMIEGFSELATLGKGEGGIGEEDTLLQGNEPLDTTATPFGNNALSCTFSQPSFVTINNINAEERSGECIDQEGGGTSPKTKSYTFATQNNSLIVIGYYGNSTTTYNQHLPLFEESVRTINIAQPADIATSEIYNRYKQLVESQLSNQTKL